MDRQEPDVEDVADVFRIIRSNQHLKPDAIINMIYEIRPDMTQDTLAQCLDKLTEIGSE